MVIKSNVLLSCVVCVHARASEGAESLVWSSIRHMIKTWKMFLWLSCGWLSVELRSHKNNNKSTVGVLDVQTNSAVNDYINMHTWNHVIRRNQVRAKKKKKKIRVFACTVIKLPNPYFKWIGEMWLCSLEIFSKTVSPTQWGECNDSERSSFSASMSLTLTNSSL